MRLFFYGPQAFAIFLGQQLTSVGKVQLFGYRDPGYVSECSPQYMTGPASCGHRPVRPRQPQTTEEQPLKRLRGKTTRKPLISLALLSWLLGLDSNQQPSG
jgi:hypothetical protein